MFAGSPNGDLLSPYVVYKSKTLQAYKQQSSGVPDGAKYTGTGTFTKSGWFEDSCFANWFRSVCPPYLRKVKLKVLIGHNLSSHINKEVFDLCHHNNTEVESIRFVRMLTVPSNLSHNTQPFPSRSSISFLPSRSSGDNYL